MFQVLYAPLRALLRGAALIGVLLSLLARAQAPAEASDPQARLSRALALARTDTARARLYLDLADEVLSDDSAGRCGARARTLLLRAMPTAAGAERRRLLSLLGTATRDMAIGCYETDNHRAQALYRAAADLSRRGSDVDGQVMALFGLGVLRNQHDGDKAGALRAYQAGVRAGERVPAAWATVADCLGGISDVYLDLGDTTAALRFQERAVAVAERTHDTEHIVRLTLDLATQRLAVRRETEKVEPGIRRAQQLLASLRGHAVYDEFASKALRVLGRLRFFERRWAEAGMATRQALTLDVRQGTVMYQANDLRELAQIERQLHHLPLALGYARRASGLLGTTGPLEDRQDTQALLARLYEELRQPQAALDHYRRFIELRDSLQNETSIRAADRQRLSDEYATKEARLQARQAQREAVAAAEARRQRQLRYALLLVAGLLVALAGVLWNRNRVKQRANALLESQKLDLAVAAGKLEAANRTKDRLFAIVAHDLRNPLAALTGIQALIQRYVRRGEPERIAALGDHLHQTAHSLNGVLDNVLGWAVSQRGELDPRPEAVDVAALVQEAAGLGQLHASAHEIKLRVRVAPDLTLRTDPQMLRTLLRNLLGNALKFTPAGGVVTLAADAHAGGLRFRVTDTGPGFSAAAARAWESVDVGVRIPDASGRTGVGLGLVVCRAFAQQLGGQLAWHNRATGGAELTLWLPLDLPAELPVAAPAQAHRAAVTA